MAAVARRTLLRKGGNGRGAAGVAKIAGETRTPLIKAGISLVAEKPIKLFATRAERYPEAESADVVQGASRAALSLVPVFGGPALELLSLVVTPSLGRRRDDWLRELADDFDQLEAKVSGFRIENLVNNEPFISAVVQATRTATGTHLADKRAMLRNALVNIAVGKGPGEELQEVFVAAIDAFPSPTSSFSSSSGTV